MPVPSSYVRVSGTLRLPVGELPGVAKRLVLRVLEVSRADAAAEVVVERVRRNVELSGAIPFEIRVPPGDIPGGPGHSFIVQAHIDVAGTGELSDGDYFTTRSYPVLVAPPTSTAPTSTRPDSTRSVTPDATEELEIEMTRI